MNSINFALGDFPKNEQEQDTVTRAMDATREARLTPELKEMFDRLVQIGYPVVVCGRRDIPTGKSTLVYKLREADIAAAEPYELGQNPDMMQMFCDFRFVMMVNVNTPLSKEVCRAK